MRAQIDRGLPEDIEAYLKSLRERLDSPSMILFGSMVTGTPGRWSDFDFLLIADGLPADYWERQELLWKDKPPFVDIIGFTPAEVREKMNRGLILDALLLGKVLYGDVSELKGMAARYVEESGLTRSPVGYVRAS